MAQFLEFFQAHPVLFVALAVVIVLLIANEVHGNLTGGKRLSVSEAVRLINDRDPVVLDVRSPADFRKGHLLHAINAPLTKLDENLGQLKDKSKPVLIYCALGTSAQ
jgi:predicted sulfurtransferase